MGLQPSAGSTSTVHIRASLLASTVMITAALPAMAQDEVVLDTVVVTAAGFEQALKDAPASVTVVTAEELEKGAFRNLTDALREVQGVSVTGIANERDISIRGLPGSYTLVLVDGRRQGTRESRPNGSSGIEQNLIPPISAIERIEIVRGPMSSLYGSDAMGGVINIITKKADQVWSGSVTVEGTAQGHSDYGNSSQLSFNVMGPLVKDRLSLQIWGRAMDRAEDRILDGSQARRDYNLAARLTYTPDAANDLWLELGRVTTTGSSTGGRVLAAGSAGSESDNSRSYWAVGHKGRLGAATTELSFQRETGQRENTAIDAATGVATPNARVPRIVNEVLDGKVTLPAEWMGRHTIVGGFQWSRATLRDTDYRTTPTTMQADQWALFAEDEWRLSDTFAITGGVRLNNHESYGNHVTPRLYAVWHMSDKLTLKGGVSTGFKAPDLRQVATDYYTATQQGAGWIAGNPNLKPERSTSYELSLLWDNGADLSFGATAFYTDFKDKLSNENSGRLIDATTGSIIDPLGGAACNAAAIAAYPGYRCLWQSFNIDNAVVKGVELTAAWEATANLRFRGSYTYTDSEQKTGAYAGFPLARTPKHRASIRGDWATPVAGLDSWAAVTYHGSEINGGLRIGSNGTPVTINGAAGRKYAGYTTLDIGGSYAVNDRVRVNAAIYNILDKQPTSAESNTVGEGRRLWLGVTTTF